MKNGLVLLLGCVMVLSAGVAAAQDGRQAQETRATTGGDTGRPRPPHRPEVQTTDGDYSYCDDSGGLVCGGYTCSESPFTDMSSCVADSQQNSSEP